MRKAFAEGIGWGDAKQKLFERIDSELAPMRERYEALIAQPASIEETLKAGAQRARTLSQPFVARLREAAGLRALGAPAGQKEKVKNVASDRPAIQPVVFRDDDQTFAYKVLDAKKAVLATQSGFADPKAAMAAARARMDALTSAE
jgi:tryptophanyl-tRNA synthetase